MFAHATNAAVYIRVAGDDGLGWATVEIISVRLNDTFAPNASFPLFGQVGLNASGVETHIGYDAAVCVEVFEPWIVESYNSSGLRPVSTRIVSKGNTIIDVDNPLATGKRGTKLESVERTLNSSEKFNAFQVAHDNSVNQMLKVCRLTSFYIQLN